MLAPVFPGVDLLGLVRLMHLGDAPLYDYIENGEEMYWHASTMATYLVAYGRKLGVPFANAESFIESVHRLEEGERL